MGFGLSGCTPQAREQYSEAGQKAGEATKDTGKAMATDAKVTGEVVKDAAEETKKALDNTAVTGRLRTAITAAADIKIKDLNVDTVEKKIILKGTVASEADKDKIQKLAEGAKPNEYTVDNQLQIGDVK
jgi:osmotically-inducible protein OsmY